VLVWVRTWPLAQARLPTAPIAGRTSRACDSLIGLRVCQQVRAIFMSVCVRVCVMTCRSGSWRHLPATGVVRQRVRCAPNVAAARAIAAGVCVCVCVFGVSKRDIVCS
jgi:hypothetical protein